MHSRVIRNFFHLGAYQLANLLYPILISPYLISKVGIDNFGLLVSAQALMTFLIIICDYGFNMTATKDISLSSNNMKSVEVIFNSVMCVKFLLLFVCFIFLLFLISFVPFFISHSFLFLISFLIPLGRTFFPIWFFQGMQKMQYLIFYSFFSKGIAAVLIFSLVNYREDYLIVNPIIGGMDFLATLIIIIIAKNKFKLSFFLPGIKNIKEQTKKSFFMFTSIFFSNISTNLGVIILGNFVSPIDLGIYSVAERAISLIKQFPLIIFQAVYPHVSRMWIESKIYFFRYIKNLFFFLLICISLIAFFTASFSETISLFFSHENNKEIGILLKYMVCLTIISGLNIPAFIVILLTEKTKFFSSLVVFANIFYLLIGFFLSYKYGYWGIVIAILICDLIITIANNFMAIKLKLFYSDNKTSIKISEVNIN